jgi:hypothetical protein
MLAQHILGSWRLVSHEVRHADGRITYPMGQDMKGLLLYTADGYVAANLMACKRPRPVGGVMRSLPDEVLALLARGYMAYAGPYRVDESACIVYHDFDVCLDPEMIHTPQPRHARFVGERLELSVPGVVQNGMTMDVILLWERPQLVA